jgi:hypothetical protein
MNVENACRRRWAMKWRKISGEIIKKNGKIAERRTYY